MCIMERQESHESRPSVVMYFNTLLNTSSFWEASNRQLRTPVVFSPKDLRAIVQLVHKDLSHYGKRVTFHAAKQTYEVAMDLSWEEGEKELSSCVPCQLYRPAPRDYPRIHPYGTKWAFEMWEIDFVGPQCISVEEGHSLNNWDVYLHQALFAFHAHTHSRLGVT